LILEASLWGNLLSQVPESAQPWVATLLRTVFEQHDADAVKSQMRHALDALEAKFPKAPEHLDAAQHDLLAFTASPREIWRQIWSNNPQERLNKEIRFLRSQADALLACDFFETVTLSGAQLYVFAVIEHANRRVHILGATTHLMRHPAVRQWAMATRTRRAPL
jgi:hypothetical protein